MQPIRAVARRDLPTFAHVVARERLQIAPLDMCTELTHGPYKGQSFCHWYLKKDSRRIATLARHKNMMGPRMPLDWHKNGTTRPPAIAAASDLRNYPIRKTLHQASQRPPMDLSRRCRSCRSC